MLHRVRYYSGARIPRSDDPPDLLCRSDTDVAYRVDPAAEKIRSTKYLSRDSDPEMMKPVVSVPDTLIVIPEVKVIDNADRYHDHQESHVTEPVSTTVTGNTVVGVNEIAQSPKLIDKDVEGPDMQDSNSRVPSLKPPPVDLHHILTLPAVECR